MVDCATDVLLSLLAGWHVVTFQPTWLLQSLTASTDWFCQPAEVTAISQVQATPATRACTGRCTLACNCGGAVPVHVVLPHVCFLSLLSFFQSAGSAATGSALLSVVCCEISCMAQWGQLSQCRWRVACQASSSCCAERMMHAFAAVPKRQPAAVYGVGIVVLGW
jgi:hypothetical protein